MLSCFQKIRLLISLTPPFPPPTLNLTLTLTLSPLPRPEPTLTITVTHDHCRGIGNGVLSQEVPPSPDMHALYPPSLSQ